MMDLLKITSLRRGADGDTKSPFAANADESKAIPYPNLPDPLVLKNGKKVSNSKVWWEKRRPEIVEDFDREVYGRVPKTTPNVKWVVVSTTQETNGDIPVTTKKLVGHVDNSSYPQITVDIQLTVTTPTNATSPVPLMMEFGFGGFPGRRPTGASAPTTPLPPPAWQQQLLSKGWGYVVLIPTTVQADNGAGLTQGIIGLCNKGQTRKPDDWGALRAWAWGASRALDYLETDKSVNARQVGIEGLSRYGKAAAVTMAYDSRFAIGFIGSSGEGGVKIHRRNFGEMVENVASSAEYHWMAGNFLKYAGPLTPNDLPVDAHELVALCAPRPVFIGVGSPNVEGTWVDAKGMFLGAVGAGPVYKLLGKKDLGTKEMPRIDTGLIDGDVAFRQHNGGHTNAPNWETFLTFASRYIKAPLVSVTAVHKPSPGASVTASGASATSSGANIAPLKNAYKGKFLIGTILSIGALEGREPESVSLAQTHFDAFTAENSMKPDAVQPREGEFTFANGDKLVELARKSGATVIGHTLIWHSQTPKWFFVGPDGMPVGRELALARMRKHISTVVGRYKGKIKQWDVVNEALSDGGDSDLRPSPWRTAIGDDYIEQAFRAAHEADPDAILIYNDYNIEREYKRPKALRMLKSLLDKGVPVHAVGMQCHWRMDDPKLSEVEESIKQYAALGLKVMITEMDIGVLPTRYQGADINTREAMTPEMAKTMNPYTAGLPDDVAKAHGERYRQAFEMFLRHQKHIGRVTIWGIQDNTSWLNNFPVRGRTDYPLLFDKEGKPKPAFFAVRKAVQ
jgi:GH35 family endo-1,4-beta-xylanase